MAEAMAHVHSEYLEEDVADQGAVQMEMVMEEAINTNVRILCKSTVNARGLCEDTKIALCTEIKNEKKSTGKVFVCDNSCFQKIEFFSIILK